MTEHVLENKEKDELMYIISLLKSKEEESIQLAFGLLQNYPNFMTYSHVVGAGIKWFSIRFYISHYRPYTVPS